MFVSLIALLAAGLADASGAAVTMTPAAAPPAVSAAPATPAALKPEDRIVCRTEDTLGSRLESHKICHTAGEWKEINSNAAHDIGDSQRMGGMNHTTGRGTAGG